MSTQNENGDQKKEPIKRGPIKRISSNQFHLIREMLMVAAQAQNYENDTVRRTIQRSMPFLFFMRRRHGYKFRQLSKLLADVGIEVGDNTLREYYSSFLPGNEEMFNLYLHQYEKSLDDFCFALKSDKEQEWF